MSEKVNKPELVEGVDYIKAPECYFINYATKQECIQNCTPLDILGIIEAGFTQVSYSVLWDFRNKKTVAKQRKLERDKQRRLESPAIKLQRHAEKTRPRNPDGSIKYFDCDD